MGGSFATWAISSDDGMWVANSALLGVVIYEKNMTKISLRAVSRRQGLSRDPRVDRLTRARAGRADRRTGADRAARDRADARAGGPPAARAGAARRGLPAPRDVRDAGRCACARTALGGARGARARGGEARCG